MDERTRFLRDAEALAFQNTVTDLCALGALVFLHEAVLECCLKTTELLSRPITPAAPVDLLVLYKAVAFVFTRWDDTGTSLHEWLSDLQGLNSHDAQVYASSHSNPKVREGLARFGGALHRLESETVNPLDLLFCFQLLTPCFDNNAIFENIMSGRLGAALIEFKANPWEWWALRW